MGDNGGRLLGECHVRGSRDRRPTVSVSRRVYVSEKQDNNYGRGVCQCFTAVGSDVWGNECVPIDVEFIQENIKLRWRGVTGWQLSKGHGVHPLSESLDLDDSCGRGDVTREWWNYPGEQGITAWTGSGWGMLSDFNCSNYLSLKVSFIN